MLRTIWKAMNGLSSSSSFIAMGRCSTLLCNSETSRMSTGLLKISCWHWHTDERTQLIWKEDRLKPRVAVLLTPGPSENQHITKLGWGDTMRQSGGISLKAQPCLANPHWLTWVSIDLASHLSGSQSNWHTTVQSVRSNSMKVLSRNAKSNTVVTAADASVISAAVTLFRSQSLATLNLPVCVTAVVRKSSIMLTS